MRGDIRKDWKGHQFDYQTIANQDTDINYYVCLNQREMAMILGALTPVTWRTRWIDLPENEDFEWVEELRAKLLCANGCCDGVEKCVRDSETIREIIREIIKETTIEDPTRPLGEGNPALEGCNPDVIFGGVTSLVDILNQSILDTLEIIEVATNPLESLNLIADNNIISGALASKLIEMIDWVIANIGENYAANYTIGLRDTYRCDLFCIWQNSQNCELTLADVATYFQSRVASAPSPLMDISEVLVFIFGGVWVGPEIVDIMHLMCLTLMTASDRIGWLPIGNGYGVELAIALGLDNPDPDWALLCEDCSIVEFARCWYGENTGNNAEFPAISFIGSSGYSACTATVDGFNNLIGCYNGLAGGIRVWSAAARYDVPAEVNKITKVILEYETNANASSGSVRSAITGYDASDNVVFNQSASASSGVYSWTGDEDSIAYIRVYARCYRADTAGFANIKSIRIEGESSGYLSEGCVS